MFWTNTKLLVRLYYRPVSAISDIIDEASWIYAAVVVIAIAFLLNATVLSHIYSGYEAVARPLAEWEIEQRESLRQIAPPRNAGVSRLVSPYYEPNAEDFDEDVPTSVIERRPLPIVKQYGWWFVSFAPANFLSVLLGLALLYVPGVLLVIAFSESLGSFGVVLRRDYGSLLTCSLMAWAAGHLPFALIGIVTTRMGLAANTALALWAMSAVCFGLLMAVAVRTLFGTRFLKACGVVVVAALSFAVQAKLFAVVSPYLFSPFLLFYAWAMIRGDIGDIGFSLRQRQRFRRSMEAATINPRDAEAHYQLGLIFQRRHQYAEALERFKRATEIDPDETDAHYQLGRIARTQHRLQEALDCFSVVIGQDEQHCHHEVWREIGLTYLTALMYAEAEDALRRFTDKRPYDPEGLYYYGQTREQLGDSAEAAELFQRCVESVKTMPHYRQGGLYKWRKLAQEQLAKLPQLA